MKKIPTLFGRRFEGHKVVEVLPNITPGCEDAFAHGFRLEVGAIIWGL